MPKFAPYIDVTREQEFNQLVQYKQRYGVKAFTLAFALGGTGGCDPMWGGQQPIDDPKIIGPIMDLRAAGGDVIVATGGAMGPYLEGICGSVDALVTAYKKVLSVTGSTHIDVDVEASVPTDMMNRALASLQRENPEITVSFTLMVQGDDYGLTDILGVEVLKSAAKNGVNVDIVNPMTMEFGTSRSSWGDAVISAAEATLRQMRGVWPQKSDPELYSMLGVTPMLGRNFNGKVFEIRHAKQLVEWALQKKIGFLAFWSIGRDKGCPGSGISPSCSSIDQEDFEFTKIFVAFDDGRVEPDSDNEIIPPKPETPQNTSPEEVTTTPQPTRLTTKKVNQAIDCSQSDKRHPHPNDCNKYIWCYNNEPHVMSCGPGTVWNSGNDYCDYAQNANRPECL